MTDTDAPTAPWFEQVDLSDALEGITHDLKTWPAYFAPVWDARKTFEVRYDDRGYQTGDFLALSEWDPSADCSCRATSRAHFRNTCTRYTGRIITAEVGYALATTPRRNQHPGFDGHGFIVLGLVAVERFKVPRPSRRPVQVQMFAHGSPVPVATTVEPPQPVVVPQGVHTKGAANCMLREGNVATNVTCSPCQRAQLAPREGEL